MTTQFNLPNVSDEWAASRETSMIVAVAIHAIADNTRSAQAIWEAPTQSEWDTVKIAIENYLANDWFPEEYGSATLSWGEETINLD